MVIEPVLAVAFLPIAAFKTFLFLDETVSFDFLMSEFLMVMDPVFAVAFLPIAAFNTLLFLEETVNLDLLISVLDSSAIADKGNAAETTTTIVVIKFFIYFPLLISILGTNYWVR